MKHFFLAASMLFALALGSAPALAAQDWADSGHLLQRTDGTANIPYKKGTITFTDGPYAGKSFEVDYPLVMGTNISVTLASTTANQGTAAARSSAWPVLVVGSNSAAAGVDGFGDLKVTQGTTMDKGNDSVAVGYRNKVYWTATTTTSAGVTLDAMRSLDINKAGTVTPTQTHYTITNGKTLRITSATFCNRTGAAAVNDCQFKIRNNVAGTTTTSSALVHSVDVTVPNAVAGEGSCQTQTFPDGGMEFVGDGTNDIGVSDVCAATTNKVTISLDGYEITAP